VFLGIVGSIINNWIKRGSGSKDITKNKEFLSALREFKEKTDQRLNHLEAIVTEGEPENIRPKKSQSVKDKEQSRSIEIELNEDSDKDESSKSGNLRNMLNQ